MPDYFVQDGDDEDRTWTVETLDKDTYRVVTPEGEELEIEGYEPENGRLHMLEGVDSHDVDVHRTEENYEINIQGRRHHFEVLTERQKRMREAGVGGRGAGGPDLVSPMAGSVVEIVAEQGASVEKGETVVIVEAMKMENDLKAHKDGVLSEIHVEAGGSVEIGDALVSIEDE
ncbi:MAG: acetyl-CoA carboxylase biotin carboxyl carrier protein subunit [Bradymonadaceae bacterium]